MYIELFDKLVLVKIIVKPKNKRTYLRVKDDHLEITSFANLSESEVTRFVDQYKNEIKELLDKNEKRADLIHVLGKEYNLKIVIGNNEAILDDTSLTIFVKSFNDSDIKKRVNEYYLKIITDILKKYHIEFEKLFDIKFKVKYEIKDVKSFFGKCFFNEERIILSLKLAKYEEKYILSVLAHELAHFYHHNHSDKFYNLLEEKINGYYKLQYELKRIKYIDKF